MYSFLLCSSFCSFETLPLQHYVHSSFSQFDTVSVRHFFHSALCWFDTFTVRYFVNSVFCISTLSPSTLSPSTKITILIFHLSFSLLTISNLSVLLETISKQLCAIFHFNNMLSVSHSLICLDVLKLILDLPSVFAIFLEVGDDIQGFVNSVFF